MFNIDVDLEKKLNFGVVSEDKFYRSKQPTEEFLIYLKKTRRIKTIVVLLTEIPEFEERFCKENNINLVRLPIKSWRKWPQTTRIT